MSYSVHTLNIENHSHIIGRQDGVTGDTINANNEIVFCAACQSVFLKDSWEYMNGNHCNQSETLNFVPSPVPKLIAKKKEAKLIFKTFSKFRSRIGSFFAFVSLMAITIGWVYFLIYTNQFLPQFHPFITFTVYLILYILGGYGSILILASIFRNKLFMKITGIDKKTLRILENGIELKRDKTYSFYEMQDIHYSKTKKENRLTIHLKNGEIVTHSFPKDKYQKTKDFLYGLVWIAQFVSTTVYLENKKEHGFAKSIERNYVAKFSVLEDGYVLDAYN